jgi:hypothetical protein
MKKTTSVRQKCSKITALLLAVLSAFVMLAPQTGLEAHAAGKGGSVAVNAAMIQGANVVVTATGAVASDDGIYHLYAQQPFEGGAQGTEVAQAPAGAAATFTFALGKNTGNSNLFKKFTVVAVRGGVPTQVSNACYITNPEAAATHTAARRDHGKKGILPAATMLNTKDLTTLGIKQVTYNVPIGDMCNGGGVNYTYNGKQYSFNKNIVGQYDLLVPKFNSMGIQVTLILLNNLTGNLSMIHPLSRNVQAGALQHYYAFNTAEQVGVDKLEALASFLGQRYSNNGHGTVDNWIIGNEVNARADWNYMSAVDVNTFANEYAKAVRIFYNGIKSENGNAKVYISIDQQWSQSSNPALYYGSRDFLNAYNSIVSAEGNFGWDVAIHPYDVPLYNPMAWAPTGLCAHSQASRYVSMQNIDVLTDYLSQKAMLSPNGQVKSVMCSEVGYTSLSAGGEAVQAAAIAYGYTQAAMNQHIDGFILSRELDDAGEIGQGLANGIINLNGSHKLGYDYYANIDGANAAAYQAAAAQTIGTPNLMSLMTVR